jgi:hypothetical protein
MVDRSLTITWQQPSRGREERALECLNEALGILGRKQQEGAIEGFEVCLLSPNAMMNGFVQITGTAQQIAALRDDEAFLANTADAMVTNEGITHIEGYVNDGVAGMVGRFQEAIGKVPQNA